MPTQSYIDKNGKPYNLGGTPTGVTIGSFKFSGFTVAELPTYEPGWIFCGGQTYALTSDVGKVLAALPAAFKTRFGIVANTTSVNAPKFFYSDGRGLYLRAADGSTRAVGSVVQDRLQQMTGAVSVVGNSLSGYGSSNYFGTLYGESMFASGVFATDYGSVNSYHAIAFSAALAARTGTETSVLDIGLTPVMYVGVN